MADAGNNRIARRPEQVSSAGSAAFHSGKLGARGADARVDGGKRSSLGAGQRGDGGGRQPIDISFKRYFRSSDAVARCDQVFGRGGGLAVVDKDRHRGDEKDKDDCMAEQPADGSG